VPAQASLMLALALLRGVCLHLHRHGPVGVGPEEGDKSDSRAGTPLLGGKAERVEAVQPGEKAAPGRYYCSLSVPEGAYRKAGENLF